jgi:hypothetical protein
VMFLGAVIWKYEFPGGLWLKPNPPLAATREGWLESEAASQKSEVGSQKSEDGSQKSEDGSQTSDVASDAPLSRGIYAALEPTQESHAKNDKPR